LNGKVEGSQKTDKIEFYPTVDRTEPELAVRLDERQLSSNWHHPHSSVDGRTPIEQTPLHEEADARYDADQELVQKHNYKSK